MNGDVAAMVRKRLVAGAALTVILMFTAFAMNYCSIGVIESLFESAFGLTPDGVGLSDPQALKEVNALILMNLRKVKLLAAASAGFGLLMAILIWIMVIRAITTYLGRAIGAEAGSPRPGR